MDDECMRLFKRAREKIVTDIFDFEKVKDLERYLS